MKPSNAFKDILKERPWISKASRVDKKSLRISTNIIEEIYESLKAFKDIPQESYEIIQEIKRILKESYKAFRMY